MKKLVTLLFVVLCAGFFATSGYCAKDSPEQHVKNFYVWYIEKEMQGDALYTDGIEEFVDHCVLQNLRIFRKRWYYDHVYLLASQDVWDEMIKVLVVHPAMRIDETTSLVPVSFNHAEGQQHQLVVFVEKQDKGYRVTKVIDTRP